VIYPLLILLVQTRGKPPRGGIELVHAQCIDPGFHLMPDFALDEILRERFDPLRHSKSEREKEQEQR
jgi:hypothetical protein